MNNTRKPIPITLLTGYLGAGKTTLINHVLNNQEGYKCAVIVNDIGEVNIDAELIQKTGVVTQEDQNLVPLSNGCICCTLNVDLINQITDLCESGKYDYILIEASGICEPLPIAQSIAMLEGDEETPALCHLDNIATVVDALRLASEFGCGDDLLKKEVAEEDIENLLIQQIEFCSTIVLNKVDMVKPEQLDKVKAMIKVLQPKARIIETTYGKVAVGDILDTNSYTFEDLPNQQVGLRFMIRMRKSWKKNSITLITITNIMTMTTIMNITTMTMMTIHIVTMNMVYVTVATITMMTKMNMVSVHSYIIVEDHLVKKSYKNL